MKKIIITSLLMAGLFIAPVIAYDSHMVIYQNPEISSEFKSSFTGDNKFSINYDANSNTILFYTSTMYNSEDNSEITLSIYDPDENILAGTVIDKKILRIKVYENKARYFIYKIFKDGHEIISGKLPIIK